MDKEPRLVFKGQAPPPAAPDPKEKLPELPKNVPSLASAVAAPLVTQKVVRAHKIFGAIFKIAIKKWPELADELELDQNDKDLLDEAFSPILRKFFGSIGVSDQYIDVVVAVLVVLLPRFMLIASTAIKGRKKGKDRDPEKPPEKKAPSGPPPSAESSGPAGGASAFTWKGAKA